MAMTTTRMTAFFRHSGMRAHASLRFSRTASARYLDRLRRRRSPRPQSLEIVELAHLGSEHMHDHVAGIDQHPVAIGQALDMDAFHPVFLQALRHILRDRANVP